MFQAILTILESLSNILLISFGNCLFFLSIISPTISKDELSNKKFLTIFFSFYYHKEDCFYIVKSLIDLINYI